MKISVTLDLHQDAVDFIDRVSEHADVSRSTVVNVLLAVQLDKIRRPVQVEVEDDSPPETTVYICPLCEDTYDIGIHGYHVFHPRENRDIDVYFCKGCGASLDRVFNIFEDAIESADKEAKINDEPEETPVPRDDNDSK